VKSRLGLLIPAAALLSFALALTGCSSDPPTAPDPHAPVFEGTMFPRPTDGPMIGAVVLTWSCTDPDNDPLTYTVYYGPDRSAQVIVEGLHEMTFPVLVGADGRTYTWWVVATDSTGRRTRSRTQRFASFAQQIYPLSPRLQWLYEGVSYAENFTFDPSSTGLADTVDVWSAVTVESLDTLPDMTPAYRLRERNSWDEGLEASYLWMDNTDRGLLEYAYLRPGAHVAPLKISSGAPIFELGRVRARTLPELFRAVRDALPSASSQSADSAYIEDPPRVALAYPLEVGAEWTAVDDGGFRIDKKITDQVDVTTPIGTFAAYEIEWTYDIDWFVAKPGPEGGRITHVGDPDMVIGSSSVSIIDYIGVPGLLKRTIRINGISYSEGPGPGSLLGSFDAVEEWLLEATVPSLPEGVEPIY